jgi:nucleoside-diphosphate-sugar epimerase
VKVLITSAGDNLPRQIANSLGVDHDILLTDREDVSTRFQFVRSGLNHTAPTNDLVRGVDVIVHSGAVDPRASISDQLDYQMRCTYNLLKAAWEEGVPRVVYLSSLRLMEGYDSSYAVTERWKPTPTLERDVLCYHLGEIVCREFARERKTEVTILRLGEITPASETSPSTSALYEDDAMDAVRLSLNADHSGWLDIFHIQSDVPDARFLTGQPWQSADDVAQSVSLGYTPRNRG